MTTWILTTGNSDVQLKTEAEAHWKNLYKSVQYEAPIDKCNHFLGIAKYKDEETKRYIPPARVLGLVYGQSDAKKYYQSDLVFPLLDTFLSKIQELDIDKVIILLTDQAQLFQEDIEKAYYPFWQDTCELESILQWYFQEKSNLIPEFCYLKPTGQRGIDHWNEMLKLMSEELEKIDIDADKTVYVSHQAGTPAISSALQFVSLGKFSQVQFLMSNQLYVYDDDLAEIKQQSEAELIPSSNYWRGIQIQKAKQLILAGLPGAALELLEDIYDKNSNILKEIKVLVDRFNIKYIPEGTEEDEFKPRNAIDRIRTALDLIEIYFNNENYLQGITLLTSAQETFLKAAIVRELANKDFQVVIKGSKQKRKGQDLIQWTDEGLYFIENLSDSEKEKVLNQLNFPKNKIKKHKQLSYRFINDNNGLFYLLGCLNSNLKSWKTLKWLCIDKDLHNEHEDDLRNQLMHNLRGVKEEDVIKFLLGNSNPSKKMTVVEAYKEYVKKPFIEALYQLKLRSDNSADNQLQKELQNLADSLQ